MKRGLFFTLTVITLFSLLFLLASNRLLASSQGSELAEIARLRKVAYSWDDVNEDLERVGNSTITQSGNNLSISDWLPAPHDLASSLLAYSLFIQNYYQTPELNFTFLSPSGAVMPLSSLGPPLQVLPYGINYSYPDYGKNELFIKVPAANFSAFRQLHANITLPEHWFNENVANIASDPCSFWSPLQACNPGTTNCLNFTARIVDKNGTLYESGEGCKYLNADQNSNMQLNLNYSGGSNAWIKVLVGRLDDLLDVKLQNANISINTTMVLNSSEFSANFPASLRVLEPSSNASKSDSLKG